MHRSTRSSALIAPLVVTVACGGRSHATPPPPAGRDEPPAVPPVASHTPAAAPSRDTSWLTVDNATRTTTMALVVTRPEGAASALINGFRAGEVRAVVPLGWTVKWNWRNDDGTEPHSLVVMTQREKIPLEGGRAAFSNAMSRMVTAGLARSQTDQTTFEADEAGWYWLLCGVPGHALNGEWIELQVSPDAKTASIQVKQSRP